MKKDGIQTRNRKMSAKSKRHKKTLTGSVVIGAPPSGAAMAAAGHHHPLDFAISSVVGGYDKHYATNAAALSYNRQQLASYMTGSAGRALTTPFISPAAVAHAQGHPFPTAHDGYAGASGNHLSAAAMTSGGLSAAIACGNNFGGPGSFDSQLTHGLNGFSSTGMIGAVA